MPSGISARTVAAWLYNRIDITNRAMPNSHGIWRTSPSMETSQLRHITLQERIAHPGNTENSDYRLHSGRKYRTLRRFDSICLRYQQDDSAAADSMTISIMEDIPSVTISPSIRKRGAHTFKRAEKYDKGSSQYEDEYGKHGGTFVLDIFNLYLLVIEKTFFQAFLIFGILYQFLADFHGE